MSWSDKQILDTLRLIEASEYDEVRIETADFKLHVRKSGAPAGPAVPPPASTASTAPASPVALAPALEPAPPIVAPQTLGASAEDAPPGIVVVRSPMVGTFYRAPSPQSPPFVDAGGTVESSDTVCLIEVMKLFNTIKAGVNGKVIRILAQNAASVRKDEPLLWIEPADGTA